MPTFLARMRAFVALATASTLVGCHTNPKASDVGDPAAPEEPASDASPPDGIDDVDDASVDDDAGDQDSAPPPARGCSREPSGVGTVTAKQTTAAGLSRNYFVSTSPHLDAGRAYPVVFVLHGAGDSNPPRMREWFGVEGQLGEGIFVYPQALPRTRKDGTGEFIPRWDLYGNEDLAFYDTMLTEIADEYCIDRRLVFATGFSSGGNFANQLACLRQSEIRAIGAVAGPGPFTHPCGGAVAVWMTHDVDDAILPIQMARDARVFWSEANGCGTSWAAEPNTACSFNPTCPSNAPFVYCETRGFGHQTPAFAVGEISSFFRSILSANGCDLPR